MGFIDSYKHLEKLCGEVLNDDRRLSAYIDEMLCTPRGSYYVWGWDALSLGKKSDFSRTGMHRTEYVRTRRRVMAR